MLKINAHTAFASRSGYGYHAREFFTALNKYAQVKVNDLYFGDVQLTNEQNQMVLHKTGNYWPWEYGTEFDIDKKWSNDKIVDIILSTTGDLEFWQSRKGHKVAYNVWESTRQPTDFFKQLLEYDQLWVPSNWQRNVSIEQGFSPDRVIVIPEGIDTNIYYPNYNKTSQNTKFRFLVVGKWENRKSTKEIIQAFINEFKQNEQVELYLLADNPWATDQYKNTEDRLIKNNLNDDRIKVIHYLNFNDYIDLIKNSDCFVSCSKSEGWNIPLMESIACGVPTIATHWGAPLDFCADISLLVDIKGFKQPIGVYGYEDGTCPGEWSEPNFQHLQHQMRNIYENYSKFKTKAIEYLPNLEKFKWNNIAKKAFDTLINLIDKPFLINKNKYIVSYHDGVSVNIKGNDPSPVNVKFYDDESNALIYDTNISAGHWASPNAKYYVKWKVQISDSEKIRTETINLKNKRVLILFNSSALGDTIAWLPYVEKFKQKHNCHITIRTFHNYLFEKTYPDFEWIDANSITSNFSATYRIGVFDNDNSRNRINWKTIPLQRVVSDILGLEYEEIVPRIAYDENKEPSVNYKYVAISPNGSTKAKLWNYNNGWQQIIDYLNSIGYKVMVISKEKTDLKNIIDKTNQTIEETINNIKHSEFYIGCGSGPSWLAYGLNKSVILISGFSQPWTEFLKNCYRVINKNVCHGCYNMAHHEFDRGDWEWCPEKKNFECTKSITPDMVIEKINKCISDLKIKN